MDRINIVCLLVMLFGLPACVPATVDSAAGLIAITEDAGTMGDVEVDERSTPRQLIYVLDPASNVGAGQQSPQILAVDPNGLEVAYTIKTGLLPDVALSADGRFLYIVDSHDVQAAFQASARLRIYDIYNNQFLPDEASVSDRLLYKGYPLAAYPFFLVSPDGNRLFVRQYGYPDQHQFRLTALDTTTFDVLHQGPQPACDRIVLALAAAWLCANNLDLTLVDPESGTRLDQLRPADLIREAHSVADNLFWQIAGWAWTPDGRSLWLLGYEVGSPTVRRDQAQTYDLVQLDFSALGQVPLAEVSFQIEPAVLRLEAGHSRLNLLLAPDGSRLYLGLNRDGPGSLPLDQVWVYDTTTWEKTAVLELPHPTWHVALSLDGRELYAVSPFANSLAVFDTELLRETAVLEGLGYSPAQIIVPSPVEDTFENCPVTLPPDTPFTPPAPYPATAPYTDQFWYGSESLWLMLPVTGRWPQLAHGDKMFWWRVGFNSAEEQHPALSINARHLHDLAPPIRVGPHATNAYHPDFHWAMLSGLRIPTDGCWEITGEYENHQLSFVVWISP